MQQDKQKKQADKLLKMPGKLDRGPVEFQSHIVEHSGEVMEIATRDVISVPPTTTIIEAVGTMTRHGFRRLPVTDAGSHKLIGIVTVGDIISLLGGGDKYNLVRVKHHGNLIAAINESIREIMTTRLEKLEDSATIQDAAERIVSKKTGGLPIVDEKGILVGIVTERDCMKVLCTQESDLTVEDVMSTKLRVTHPDTPIGTVTQEMVKNRLRRLPVVSDDVIFGIITASDIMGYVGSGKIFEKLVTGDVAEVMGLPVRNISASVISSATPEQQISEAAREMLRRGFGAMPVIEGTRLVGIVTEFDLVKAFSRG